METIKKNYKAWIDGIISGLLIFVLGSYSMSVFVSLKSVYFDIVIVLLCVLFSAVSAVYNLKNQYVRGLLIGYLISFLSCFCCIGILFGVSYLIDFTNLMGIFPQRDLSNADGLIIFLYEGIYLIGTICIRMVILVIRLVRILKRSKCR